MSDLVLVAEGLGKSYPLPKGDLCVFEGLDFVLRRGELAAVMGASGVGKTTLLNLLGGLDRPSAGRVLLDGGNLFAGSDREIAAVRNRKIGFVFQVYHLLPEFTALENVSFPLMIGGATKKDAFAGAEAMLREVGLEDKTASRPGQLSGGEQQRVAIARALVNEPEPASGRRADGEPRLEDGGERPPPHPRPPRTEGAVLHPGHPQREDRPLLSQRLHDGGGPDETNRPPGALNGVGGLRSLHGPSL